MYAALSRRDAIINITYDSSLLLLYFFYGNFEFLYLLHKKNQIKNYITLI